MPGCTGILTPSGRSSSPLPPAPTFRPPGRSYKDKDKDTLAHSGTPVPSPAPPPFPLAAPFPLLSPTLGCAGRRDSLRAFSSASMRRCPSASREHLRPQSSPTQPRLCTHPLRGPGAHLSALPRCAQKCIRVSESSIATALHGSLQELSENCDLPLPPLAPAAAN